MKTNDREKEIFSDSIDKVNEGMESIIELYNNLEEDVHIIAFDDDVISLINQAKSHFGEEFVSTKINTLIREIFSLLEVKSSTPTEQ